MKLILAPCAAWRASIGNALLALVLGACAAPAAMSDASVDVDTAPAAAAAAPKTAAPTTAVPTVAMPSASATAATAAESPTSAAAESPTSAAAESPAPAPPASWSSTGASTAVAQAGTPSVDTATPAAALPLATPKPTPAPQQPYAGRDEARAFARALETSRGIDAAWALAQLDRAVYVPQVAKLMLPPPAGTAKDWAEYRARFVEPKRIAAGAAFWRANEAWLDRANARWGVPPWLVVGIVGVETYYGRITGNFRVIDALATLSFDFPAARRDRSPFFTAQLEEYLHWCRREAVDPQSVLGSYAGAIGLPQFMPGSINRWAVDFDEDGRVDLQRNHADVVGSVAHYMAAHGWQRDMPTTYDVLVPVDAAQRAALLGPDIVPTFSAAQMQAQGAVLRGQRAREHAGPLALVELQNGDKAPSYFAGTENFYVVTRYNWSSYYAMAVIELGRAVEAELRRSGRAPAP
jgi:membrane-bound lytic murein transglycosylase B